MIYIAILFPVGSFSGMGHFRRSQIIHNFLKKKKIKIIKFPLKDKINLNKNNSYINEYFEKVFSLSYIDTLIIDFSSISVIKRYKNLKKIIYNKAEKKEKKLILIDSIKSEKLSNKYCYKRVIPYYLKNNKIRDGFKYVIVDPKLFKIKKPNFKKTIKILITCGGSDTKNTLYICNQILKLNKEIIKKLNFKIIIGQFCKRSFYNKIKKKFKNFYNCKIIYGAKSNYYNYLWSDTVICSDGTTKYEALAAGRYTIVIKTNKLNDIYGKDFEKLGLFGFIKRNNNNSRKNVLNFLHHNKIKKLKKLTKHVNDFKSTYFKNSINNYYDLLKN